MRPITNLKASEEFKLDKHSMQSGFVALWNAKVGENAYDFVTKLVLNTLYPYTRTMSTDMEGKGNKDFITDRLQDKTQKYAVRSSLVKNSAQRRFEFRAPIYHSPIANNSIRPLWFNWLTDVVKLPFERKQAIENSVTTLEDTPFAGGKILSGSEVANLVTVNAKGKNLLTNCLIGLEATVENDVLLLWATWAIKKEEAEYLNNTSFLEIKLSNFYPALKDWSASVMGKTINMPSTIAPISKISLGVKAAFETSPPVPRVGIDNTVVDIGHNYYIIPEVDNCVEYEQRMMDFGLQEDGSYTFHQKAQNDEMEEDLGVPSAKKKLPINMPIFTDWLNDKFAYSNSNGNLSVYDLSNTSPVQAQHLLKVLNTIATPNFSNGVLKVLFSALGMASVYDRGILQERPTAEDVSGLATRPEHEAAYRLVFQNQLNGLDDVLVAAVEYHKAIVGDVVDLYEEGGFTAPRLSQVADVTGLATFRFVGRMIQRALTVIEENLEVMFSRYSVMTVLQMQAILGIVVKHSKHLDVLHQEDQQDRDAYINQGLDPEYKPEALPLIKAEYNYLPHQFRVHNKMRKGPKLAIWGVDAGGGKTHITLTNTLNELQNKRCSRPLILCPAHLVANYIQDVVYVTEGRLNIIPLTNCTMRMHGEEGLTKMIVNAPRNTVFIADYNFLQNRRSEVAYGNKTISIFRNVEFLRQFEFDMVVCDECHYLKNLSSLRRNAASRLIQDIPMKRLTSGTIVADTLKDLVSQVALLDPTIFGSEENFKREFAEEMRGEKVLAYKPGAEREVMNRIQENCVFATAKRKEWAALLPPKTEKFYGVDLTENQRLLYESILKETMELIEAAAAKDPDLKEAMESEDESIAESLEAKLRPYMARLERYLSAPDSDPAAQIFLKDPIDLISPKAIKIYDLCRQHIQANLPGKILIFTQYTASAESVYLNAPPDLKPLFIHYTAAEKAQCRSEYERNPEKKIMIGVSSSMDTGLNFQHVSRLIRMETVWTPGVMEQGNSRVNRPQLKKSEARPHIYFDWLVVNKSVDITKVSRLIAKMVSKAKFDEHDNPEYQRIPNLPQVPVTVDSIATHNDFKEELLPYLEAYRDLQSVQKEDYARYLEDHKNEPMAYAVPQNGVLEGSKIMRKVPYIPEMEIYGVGQLGLLRYDQYLNQDNMGDVEVESEDEKDDEGLGLDENDPRAVAHRAKLAAREKERALLKNMPCHTEFGDGILSGIGGQMCTVQFSDGSRKKLFKMQVYIITRAYTNGVDLRNEMLKQIGDIPIDTPPKVVAEESPIDTKLKKKKNTLVVEAPPADTLSAEFDFTIVNDFLGLRYRGDGSDKKVISILQNAGFRFSPDYWFTYIPVSTALYRLFNKWKGAGFTIDKETSETFKHIHEAMKHNKAALQTYGFSASRDLVNFYREQIKPSADQNKIKVYPLVEDGRLYVALPIQGQAANKRAVKVPISGIKWKVAGGETDIIRFFSGATPKADAVALLKELKASGVNLTNSKELEAQFKKIKLAPR